MMSGNDDSALSLVEGSPKLPEWEVVYYQRLVDELDDGPQKTAAEKALTGRAYWIDDILDAWDDGSRALYPKRLASAKSASVAE